MKFIDSRTRMLVLAALAAAALQVAQAAIPDPPECVAPAKAGGGFDLTCKLAAAMLDKGRGAAKPMRISYLPGGIGAVAYDRMVSGRMENPAALVAFSSGSLLNLAQGKFGPHTASDVRWVAAIGTDYGAIAVRKDSPLQSLRDLDALLKRDLRQVVFGAGGTVGSQDWVKAALVVKASGRDHKAMRFVSFEGGGEALAALEGRHVTVFCGDMAEAMQAINAGAPLRILAVLSDKRLPGAQAAIPTAREQGLALSWPTVRGLYLGRNVSDEDSRQWSETFRVAMTSPAFDRLRAQAGFYPFTLTGAALDAYVHEQMKLYTVMARDLGLRVP